MNRRHSSGTDGKQVISVHFSIITSTATLASKPSDYNHVTKVFLFLLAAWLWSSWICHLLHLHVNYMQAKVFPCNILYVNFPYVTLMPSSHERLLVEEPSIPVSSSIPPVFSFLSFSPLLSPTIRLVFFRFLSLLRSVSQPLVLWGLRKPFCHIHLLRWDSLTNKWWPLTFFI